MKLRKGLWKNVKMLLNTKTKLYRIISAPGKVTPELFVPNHIVKPDYARGSNPERPNTIDIKSDDEIMRMKRAGSLAKHVLSYAKSFLKPGITTDEIDKLVHYEVLKHDAYPSPLRYKGFPKSCCTSINNVICHGVPDGNELVSGDIINVDVSVFLNGCHGDTSDTFAIGHVDRGAVSLIKVTHECLNKAIEACGPGRPFNVIGKVIENRAANAGYSVCRRFIGHGIGSYFHGPPNIFHYATPRSGDGVMKPGMTFTIEPILMEGSYDNLNLNDGWTVVTKDGGRAAQSEHTLLITNHGCEVLT